jgi:hypothetical protein
MAESMKFPLGASTNDNERLGPQVRGGNEHSGGDAQVPAVETTALPYFGVPMNH